MQKKFVFIVLIMPMLMTNLASSYSSANRKSTIAMLIKTKKKSLREYQYSLEKLIQQHPYIVPLFKEIHTYDDKIEKWITKRKQYTDKPDCLGIIDARINRLKFDRYRAIIDYRWNLSPVKLTQKIQYHKAMVQKKDELEFESKKLKIQIANLEQLQKAQNAYVRTPKRTTPSLFIRTSLYSIPEEDTNF